MHADDQPLVREKIQWERMLPAEFRAALAALPVVFLPLGTVEWHGEHNALGLDALKAHELCVRAAHCAGGGVVHPPLYGGMGGLDMYPRPPGLRNGPRRRARPELLHESPASAGLFHVLRCHACRRRHRCT